jgi:hypothetical protein
VPSGVIPNPSDFQAIWDTPQGSTPQGLKWSIRGEDLCLQRINVEPLFFQLLLVNRWTNGLAPAFSTDADPSNLIQVQPGGQGTNFYFLDSTVINLWTNAGGISNLVTRFLLKRNTSYIFENGMWQGQIMSAPPAPDPATQFALRAQIFFNASFNTNGIVPAYPSDVLSKMFTYMADASMANTLSLGMDTTNLFWSAGTNGLLRGLVVGGGGEGPGGNGNNGRQ